LYVVEAPGFGISYGHRDKRSAVKRPQDLRGEDLVLGDEPSERVSLSFT
jgi:hypothetical protein